MIERPASINFEICRPASRRRRACVSIAAVAALATCGCSTALVGPLTSMPDSRVAATAHVPGVAPRFLPGAAGTDLGGSEARFAVVGVFVAPPGEGADFIGSGAGEGVAFSFRSKGGGDPEGDLYLEWGLGRSSHEETATGSAAEYWRATGGFRWSFAWGGRAELFLALGGGYHEIDVSGGREIVAPGAYGGAGVEILLGRAWSMLLDAKLNYFWSDDPGYSAVFAAGLGLRM